MSSRFIRGPEVRTNVTVKTTAGNVTCADESLVIVNKASGTATTVTLPPTASLLTGQRVTIKDGKGDAATNPITIVPAAGTIDGAASSIINQAYGFAAFDYNGTEWGLVMAGAPASAGAGAKNGATVTASENGNATVHQTVLTLAATPVPVTDALAYASVKLYDFPEGRLSILGVTASVQWAVTTDRTTTINDSASLTWALGTAAASNITLATTMVDLCPKTTKVLAAATTALNTASTAALAAAAQFDGTGTAKDCYLNVGFETNTDIDADGTLTATGTITITWTLLGDF